MTTDNLCTNQILKMRICFALRRATGVVFDIDAMLSRPHLLPKRLAIWRAVGSQELNGLLDQLESELGSEHDGYDLDHHAAAHAPGQGVGSCSHS
jgi:hypothetical protein